MLKKSTKFITALLLITNGLYSDNLDTINPINSNFQINTIIKKNIKTKEVSFIDEIKQYSLKVEYPVTTGFNKIDKYINGFIRNSFFPENNETNLDMQTLFQKEGKNITKDLEKCEEYSCTNEYEVSINIIYQDEIFTQLSFFDYSFTGGAHGNSYVKYILFDNLTGQIINLDDIFVPNWRDKLTSIAEIEFKADLNISSLEEFWFEDGFKLNDNFLISATELSFTYNPYEIISYAFGMIHFSIPFNKIIFLVKKDSLFAKWLSKP